MSKKMMAYIESQPDVWHSALKALSGQVRKAALSMNRGQLPRRVVLLGSGSSYHAACAVRDLIQPRTDVEFFAQVPTRLLLPAAPQPGVVYWAVSQSGKSTSTQAAVEALCAQGAEVWTVTSDPASPLAQCGAGHIEIPCGEESVGPKTKGMTTTILTLWALALAVADREALYRECETLLPAFDAARENLALSRTWSENCRELLSGAACLTIVAEGPALPLAREGALKLLETLYVPASAWEFEEYLHGVNNIIGPGQMHLFLLRSGPNRERMERLIAYCRAHGAVCLTIDCGADRPGVTDTRLALRCTGAPQTLAYEALLPFQVLSAVVSAAKGIECDKPRYPDFYAALNTKIDAGK